MSGKRVLYYTLHDFNQTSDIENLCLISSVKTGKEVDPLIIQMCSVRDATEIQITIICWKPNVQ